MFKLGLRTFVILCLIFEAKYFGTFGVHQWLSLPEDLYLHMNEISFSYEWMGSKTSLVKEAKSNSEKWPIESMKWPIESMKPLHLLNL